MATSNEHRAKWERLEGELGSDKIVHRALENLMAALPDKGFAEKFRIDPEYLERIAQALDHWSLDDDKENPLNAMTDDEIREIRLVILEESAPVLVNAWEKLDDYDRQVPHGLTLLINEAIAAGRASLAPAGQTDRLPRDPSWFVSANFDRYPAPDLNPISGHRY